MATRAIPFSKCPGGSSGANDRINLGVSDCRHLPNNHMNSLLENAVSSITVGIADLSTGESERIASSMRNIHAGLTLLYKEKLRRLSPAGSDDVLLWERLTPSLDSSGLTWRGGGKGNRSVGNRELQSRLKSLGINVDWKRFDRIAKLRNQIEHYHTSANEKTIRELISTAFLLIRDFCTLHLNEPPLTLFGEETWKKMLEASEVFEIELKECRASLEANSWPTRNASRAVEHFQCSSCGSSLVQPNGSNEISCRACGQRSDLEDAIELAVDNQYGFENYRAAMDGAGQSTEPCPQCERETYIVSSDECALCGYSRDHKECARCYAYLELVEQELGGLCSYCDNLWRKDN